MTISVTVTDSNGCENTCTKDVTVNALPTVEAGDNQAVCVDAAAFSLPDTQDESPAGGSWSGPGVSGTTFTPSTAGVGTHTITYSYTDSNGCSNSDTFTITVNALPTCPITAADVCENSTGNTASTTAGYSSYNWSLSDGTITAGAGTNSITWTAPASGKSPVTVSVTVTDANGCSNTCTKTVTVIGDNTPPNDVTNLASTSPSYNNWSNNPGVTVTWTDAIDVGCAGLDGYSVLFDNSDSTVPPDTKNVEESTETYTQTLADGMWYFHIRAVDNNGNWTSTQHLGPFKIDTSTPDVVKVQCYKDSSKGTEIPHGQWTNDNTLYFEWTDPNSFSGDTFYYELNYSSGDTIGFGEANTTVNHVELTLPSEADNWWFHVAAKNGAGKEGPQGKPRKILIKYDCTAPSDPSVASADPPINTPTNDSSVDLTWNEGTDNGGSGVAGYSWVVDKIADTVPDQTMEEAGLPNTINLDNGDGDYYIHVRTKDNAGNWTSTYHYGPWELDTTYPSVTKCYIDTNPIYDGDLDQKITVTYDEAMAATPTPTIAFNTTTGTWTSNGDGAWDGAALVWTETFTITDANEEVSGVDVVVSGARDAAGNTQIAKTESAAFNVDTKNPTVTVDIVDGSLNDTDNSSVVNFTFSEPTTDFDATDVTVVNGTLSGFSGSGTSYTATFTANDGVDATGSVMVIAGSYTDAAGNLGAEGSDTVNIDTLNPTVTSLNVDTDPVYDGDLTQRVTVVYSEPMITDGSADPTITFNHGTWTSNGDGAWSGGNTWTETFTLTDNNEEFTGVQTSINGAKDAAGNDQVSYTETANVFEIDTVKPTVTSVVPTSLADADVGTVTITITFNEAMDQMVAPTVTVADLASSPYATSSSWTDTTHFTCSFTFVDNNEEATGHYHISGAKDVAGNMMAADNTNTVDVDTKNPTVTVTSTETSPTNASPIPFTITFNEDVNGFALADIIVTNGTAADFTETAAKRVYTIKVTPTADGDVSVTVPADSATDDAGNGNTAGTLTLMSDRTAPSTSFTATPPDPDNDPTPTFAWTGSDNHTATADLVYSTQLDGGGWSGWSSDTSATLATLAEGSHTFQVKAKDEAGNVETTASYTWFVDLTEPVSSIDSGPDDPTNSTSATFTFSGTDNHSAPENLTFECQLDSGGFSSCSSPHDLTGLTEGSHTFEVRATDEAGNVETTASYTWYIDLTAPSITGSRSPDANTNGWNNTDVTVHFDCTDDHSGVASLTPDTTLSGEGAGQSVTGTCVDGVGNSASTTVGNISIDKTVPAITGSRTPAANANGWNNTDVAVSFTCSDALSGIDTCVGDTTLTGEGAGQSVTGTATDKAGNTASTTVSDINIDKTKPIATANVDPAPNANGWNNADVTVSFTGTDPGSSGIDTCTDPVTLSDETPATGTDVSGTCTDKAGNTSDPATVNIRIDKTAPTLTGSRTPDPNAFGWNNTDVTVSFTCTDGLSGIDVGPVTPQVVSAEGANQSRSASCTDKAGNTSSATVSGISIDKTAPAITGSRTPAANANGWNNTDVAVSFTCSDALSGIDTCVGDTTLTGEGAGQSVTGTATDKAGNTASATVSDINIDKTPPEITIDTPLEGAEYMLNEDVIADWSVSDTVGISSSTGSSPDGGFVDTSLPGDHAFLVTATDLAGNTASLSHTYGVRYGTEPAGAGGSFLENPIGGVAGGGGALGTATLEGAFTVGDIIHLKFQLTDANGDYVTDAHPSLSIVEATITDGEESYSALPEVWAFEYDPETNEYFLNFDTSGLTAGIYDLWIAFGDETRERVRVTLEEGS